MVPLVIDRVSQKRAPGFYVLLTFNREKPVDSTPSVSVFGFGSGRGKGDSEGNG
jgi:hypothetical protein